MKKCLFLILAVFFVTGAAFAQDAAPNPVQLLGAAVRETAANIHRKLAGERPNAEGVAPKVIMGQFTYRGNTPTLGIYWVNQTIEELVNTNGRSYTVLSPGTTGANWTISGEIVEVTGIIRVYTRLIRMDGRSIEAAVHSDFERTTALAAMLSGGGGGGGGGGGSGGGDEFEQDSWDNPVTYEIGVDEQATVMNRTIQPSGDEDFFLLVPDRDGRLTVETVGSIDTYMHFYNYETREELATNDDGGSGFNARIRHNVQAGVRYLAKVRGYSSSTSGSYGFRAYMAGARDGGTSWQAPMAYEIGTEGNATVVNRTLESDDEDYFLLVPARDGRVTMETTGGTDTFMQLFDDDRELLAEDDDGGGRLNARIRHQLQAGRRYIVVITGYGSESGSYGFQAYSAGGGMLPADEFEPDDGPSQATLLEIGTPQEHTFHSSDDVDWFQFRITQPGRYVIRARGVRTNRLDTYIELFDSNVNSIAENDDGGDNLDSRLSLHFENGTYFLKVWCVDEEPDQPYTVSIERN
jgi:hypothetical protein